MSTRKEKSALDELAENQFIFQPRLSSKGYGGKPIANAVSNKTISNFRSGKSSKKSLK